MSTPNSRQRFKMGSLKEFASLPAARSPNSCRRGHASAFSIFADFLRDIGSGQRKLIKTITKGADSDPTRVLIFKASKRSSNAAKIDYVNNWFK